MAAAIRHHNPPHPDPSISPRQPPPALVTPAAYEHRETAPRRTDRSLRASQTSTVTTDVRGSVSGSSSASYPFSKGVAVDDTGRTSLEQQQAGRAAAFAQASNVEPEHGSVPTSPRIEDERHRGRRAEKYRRSRAEEWSSPSSIGASSPHRMRYRVSNFGAGDEEDQDDGLGEDLEENAFIILVSGTN